MSETFEYAFPCPHCQYKIKFLVSAPLADETPKPQPQPAISPPEDSFFSLPWKQSQKKPNLGTILVSQELLANPAARELYDKVKACKRFTVGQISYRYSKMENGTEFLQKWSPVKVGCCKN